MLPACRDTDEARRRAPPASGARWGIEGGERRVRNCSGWSRPHRPTQSRMTAGHCASPASRTALKFFRLRNLQPGGGDQPPPLSDEGEHVAQRHEGRRTPSAAAPPQTCVERRSGTDNQPCSGRSRVAHVDDPLGESRLFARTWSDARLGAEWAAVAMLFEPESRATCRPFPWHEVRGWPTARAALRRYNVSGGLQSGKPECERRRGDGIGADP